MAVDILRDGDGGVAEDFGDDPQGCALGEHDGGGGVAELVRVPVAQLRLPAEPVEVVGEVVRVERRADGGGEHQA